MCAVSTNNNNNINASVCWSVRELSLTVVQSTVLIILVVTMMGCGLALEIWSVYLPLK
jgi:hypothetical protein